MRLARAACGALRPACMCSTPPACMHEGPQEQNVSGRVADCTCGVARSTIIQLVERFYDPDKGVVRSYVAVIHRF